MIKVIYDREKQRIPIKLWLDDIEPGAMEQVMNLSNLECAFHHIAIMPDAHKGYGMPIGGVLAARKAIIPNAVGVDIGCGMCSVKTSLKAKDLNSTNIKEILGKIREIVPIGHDHHKVPQDKSLMPGGIREDIWDCPHIYPVVSKQWDNALTQIGTMGGNNHFIELQRDTEDNIWVMIHSGSRNLGKQVADHYNLIAEQLNKRWLSNIPYEWELAFLPIESQEAKNYIDEMQYCVDFALNNRMLMMNRIVTVISSIYPKMSIEPILNIAHNYAVWENHFGENVVVHRKGATLARKGMIGIIPGSQGSKSYIVRGLGNPDSFESCSHGAGRAMGRKEAERTLDLAAEIKKLDDQGIIHSIRNKEDLAEATGGYKDIDIVMNNQKDLVEILVELSPIGVIKAPVNKRKHRNDKSE